MFKISLNGNLPIYEQLIEKIEEMVLLGVLEPDTAIPSVRDFASELAINPNTVQKALQILEDEGLITTDRTNGKFVASSSKLLESQKNKTIKLQNQKQKSDTETHNIFFVLNCMS